VFPAGSIERRQPVVGRWGFDRLGSRFSPAEERATRADRQFEDIVDPRTHRRTGGAGSGSASRFNAVTL
jgi:hypothetical protein